MSKIMKKCPKCGSDVVEGQKFCIECGTAQDVKMRTKEEIMEMKEKLSAFLSSPKDETSGMGRLMFSMSVFVGMDTILRWVLNLTNDEKVFDLLKAKVRPERKF
ncbi:unnamed protein product [marine sediment metagenome]|uniref:Zinc-ribbon domain-containing protein n=1 Tax=marine sediment metagenome TaxID=412755 RepID=X1J4A6_9ZZZZ